MAIAVDASSPAPVKSAIAALTTANFDPPACVLVACTHSDPSSTVTITNNGTALTWSQAIFRNSSDGTANTMAGIYVAVLSAGRTGMTVTATSNIADDHALAVYCVTGADMVSPVGASAEGSTTANGFTTTAFTTQAAGSMGFFAADDFTTVAPGMTSSDATGQSQNTTGTEMTGITGYKPLGAAGTSATFTIDSGGTAATSINWVTVEIKAAVGSVVAAASAASAASGGSMTVTKPAGTVSGDVMVAIVATEFGTYAQITAPAGWNLLGGYDPGADLNHQKVFTRTAGGSEGANYTFTNGAGSDSVTTIVTLRGVTEANAIFAVTYTLSTSTTRVCPTVLGALPGAVLVCAAMTEGGAGQSFTSPAGMVEQADIQCNSFSAQATATLLGPPDPTGTKTFTAAVAVDGSRGGIQSSMVFQALGAVVIPEMAQNSSAMSAMMSH